MLSAIKRVISGENMTMDDDEQQNHQQQQQQQQQPDPSPGSYDGENSNDNNIMNRSNNNDHDMPSSSSQPQHNVGAALVENDDFDMDVCPTPRHHNDGGGGDDHSIAGSSISDVSTGTGGPNTDVAMIIVDNTSQTKLPPNNNNVPRTNNITTTTLSAGLPKSNLSRTDSRNSTDSFSSYGRQSSQNSSRDWGWFEDVHIGTDLHGATTPLSLHKKITTPAASGQGTNTNTNNNEAMSSNAINQQQSQHGMNIDDEGMNLQEDSHEHQQRKKKKGRRNPKRDDGGYGNSLIPNLGLLGDYGMIPDNSQEILIHPIADIENEARAMAVNAPNYVLEESLSSQRLWKYTAGNRPPQPVEERAFFEKMWAQNFARSQVEYKMPVEVLTATTPISLSPFADGNFDTSAKTMDSYNIASIGPPSIDPSGHQGGIGGGNSAGGKQHDVAEATLVSRLNDPSGHSVVSGMSGTVSNSSHHVGQHHEIVNRKVKGGGSDEDLTVLIKGDNVFGTTVSKSFARPSINGGPIAGVDTVNISIASYRVVESKKHGKYAQFLVIYREGSIRDTIGVWKRYSDFQKLSETVTKAHEGCASVIANMSPLAVTEEHDVEHLPNAITSWRLLKKRQRWYRCLDAGYLSLKVFLLERFLHDILFESSTPNLLREFVRGF